MATVGAKKSFEIILSSSRFAFGIGNPEGGRRATRARSYHQGLVGPGAPRPRAAVPRRALSAGGRFDPALRHTRGGVCTAQAVILSAASCRRGHRHSKRTSLCLENGVGLRSALR